METDIHAGHQLMEKGEEFVLSLESCEEHGQHHEQYQETRVPDSPGKEPQTNLAGVEAGALTLALAVNSLRQRAMAHSDHQDTEHRDREQSQDDYLER
ncbi:hypothetical protein [Thiorhodococcus drewsii]|nr:hypothetical protein [Thiorhodococcus drewsii]